MEEYRNLQHSADLKLEIYGKNEEELFENSMIAMFKESGVRGNEEKIKREIGAEALDINSLLVAFLSEILYLSEINDEVYWKIKFNQFNERKINGELIGEKIQERGTLIKGVTFHDLSVEKKNNRWSAVILFDI